jgi:hypothetical protein
LLLVLLAHLAVFWMLARSYRTIVKVRPSRERITYLVAVPELARAKAPPPRAAARKPAAPAPAPVVQRQRTTTAIATVTPSADMPAAEPVPPAPPSPPHLSAFDILEQARKDMPRIERELRNNVPTKLALDKNSLRYKLEHGIEDAYVGGDQRTVVDFYTSPDNAHYMRFTKAGKVWCTMHGGGGVSLRSAMGHDDGDAKVNCPPPDAGWKDMPWVN